MHVSSMRSLVSSLPINQRTFKAALIPALTSPHIPTSRLVPQTDATTLPDQVKSSIYKATRDDLIYNQSANRPRPITPMLITPRTNKLTQ
ncbi:hypothetical protein K4K55_005091 [Colletotrichum sp. SAR 10_96]|nr:hypothetical protein K4K55_005091 [Colletotrichum sp. SAR 10_96]